MQIVLGILVGGVCGLLGRFAWRSRRTTKIVPVVVCMLAVVGAASVRTQLGLDDDSYGIAGMATLFAVNTLPRLRGNR